MSIPPSHDLLQVLHATLRKIEADSAPSPSHISLLRILLARSRLIKQTHERTSQAG